MALDATAMTDSEIPADINAVDTGDMDEILHVAP